MVERSVSGDSTRACDGYQCLFGGRLGVGVGIAGMAGFLCLAQSCSLRAVLQASSMDVSHCALLLRQSQDSLVCNMRRRVADPGGLGHMAARVNGRL